VNRADRRRWAAARDLADLAELTAQWCTGQVGQTPGHAGGPARETLPYLDLLAAVNRAGFVTENSQAAGPSWTAWVCGFADEGAAGRLAAVAAGSRLTIEDMPRTARREIRYWYRRTCPAARPAIRAARLIWIEDPVASRNDLLWPVLAAFAALRKDPA
jgi:Domain of unknown function (DUF6919)